MKKPIVTSKELLKKMKQANSPINPGERKHAFYQVASLPANDTMTISEFHDYLRREEQKKQKPIPIVPKVVHKRANSGSGIIFIMAIIFFALVQSCDHQLTKPPQPGEYDKMMNEQVQPIGH